MRLNAIINVGLASATMASAILVQQGPQRPSFRTGVDVVPISVAVLDKAGKPVTDLGPADFTVYENDIEREIVSFSRQDFARIASDVFSQRSPSPPVKAPLTSHTRRLFLLVLGPDRIQVPARGIDGAIEFVRSRLLPDDLVAVLALNRVTDFTADHERVVRFLQRYSARHEGFYLDFREFRRRQPLSDLPDQFYSAIDEVFQDVPSRAADELLLGMLAGRNLNEPRWNKQPTSQDVLKAADRSRRRLADMLIDVPALKFYAGIEHLRPWEGQKHLVWIGGPLSGALQIRSVEDDKRLAARANDADVILNAIFTTGVNPGIRPDFVTGADVSTARILSESTGGYFTGLTYTNRALARIDERSRFSYLLGYEPMVKAFDGKYREVRVQVKRRDVTAHYRQGYYAVEEISPVDIRELLSRARIAAAASARDLARDIKVTVAAGSLHESEGGRRLEVRVAIDPARLSLISGPGGRFGDLDVHVFCGDSRQRPVGDTRQRIQLKLDGPNYERMMRDGIVTIVQVPVIDRPRYVKVVVYDALGDMLGAASVTR